MAVVEAVRHFVSAPETGHTMPRSLSGTAANLIAVPRRLLYTPIVNRAGVAQR
jgi:hypothetical protein